jgi:hypothetical protein
VKFAKPLYGLTPVSGVRIPPSPPFSLYCGESGLHGSKNCRKSPNSATFARKPDRRKCPAVSLVQAFVPFSPEGNVAVRFHRLCQANAMRSQTDGARKRFDFVNTRSLTEESRGLEKSPALWWTFARPNPAITRFSFYLNRLDSFRIADQP